jgi:uncharacterized protein YbgA (DUF1722 family)/uncharacterized protein YbbK (DUF523 family)
MQDTIRLGVSACLLGQNVRYDGGHKLDRFIRDTLGRYVEFVPVCPEAECGLPIPREAMRLVGDPAAPRLKTIRSGKDLTDQMQRWGESKLDSLEKKGLSGYIFKSRSPSSGMARIKVYNEKGQPDPKGVGIWARMFMDRFPELPVEDEGRLHDPLLRENFINRIFVVKRWQDLLRSGRDLGSLIQFHTRHKLMLMAHHEPTMRSIGRLLANGKQMDPKQLYTEYQHRMLYALGLRSTVKKNVNVLYHVMGYFKQHLSSDEKAELREVIDSYAKELVPLIVPVTLLNHYVRKYDQPYLQEQYYLNPHPIELKLRNHV